MDILLLLGGLLALPALAGLGYLWWRHPDWLLAGYLLLMPFHSLTFQVLGVELEAGGGVMTLVQSWKDLLLAALLGRALLPVLLTGRLRMVHPWLLVPLALYILVGVTAVLRSPSLVAGLYGFRGTFEPLALLLITLLLPLSMQWVRRIIPALLIVGGLVSLFAIVQVFVLGYPFLLRYFATNGVLPTALSFTGGAFPRANATFSSPNQVSLYLSFLILLGLNLALRLRRWRWPTMALVGLLGVALLLTVSRSGWVATVAGMLVSGLIWRRKDILVMPLLVLTLIAVPLGLALGLDRYLVRTISLNDPSAAYRLDINQQNLEVVLANPLGIGLGTVGGRALNTRILGDNAQLYNSESYYLQTAMELGIPGLLLFLILIGSCGYIVYDTIFRLRDRFTVALAVSAAVCVVAAMTHAFFIAEFQDLTVASYLWFLVGLAMRLPALAEAKQPRPAGVAGALGASQPAPAAD